MSILFRSVMRDLWSRRTTLLILTPLEAVGVAALFVGGLLVDAVMLRPVPLPNAAAVVHIWHQHPQRGWSRIFLNQREVEFYREGLASLEALVAFTVRDIAIADPQGAESRRAVFLAGDMCDLLGVAPIVGRCLSVSDSLADAIPVATIRASYAIARYREPARALDQDVRIDGRHYRIIGVVPDNLQLRHFNSHFYGPVDYMLPLIGADLSMHERRLMLMGRLRAGTTLSVASTELEMRSRAYAAQQPNANDGQIAELRTLNEETVTYAKPQAMVIAAGAVLLAVLVTFNSILVRIAEIRRRRSILTIKTALGANYRRLLGEEVANSAGGLVLTAALAWPLATTVMRQFTQGEPWGVSALRVTGSAPHFVLALVAIVGASSVGGLLVVRRLLRSGGNAGSLPSRTVGSTQAEARGTRSMVAVQCAMAAILLGCTLLLLKTMWNLANVDLGLGRENLLTVQTALPATISQTPDQRQITVRRLLDPASTPASIEAISIVNHLPLSRRSQVRPVEVAGWPESPDRPSTVNYRLVAPNYFEVVGLPLIAGRTFRGSQRAAAAEYVVNRVFVRRYLSGRDPIGTVVRLPQSGGSVDDGVASEGVIVGVVGDVRHWGLDQPAPVEIYTSYELDPPVRFAVVFRPRGGSDHAAQDMHEHLRAIAPELAAYPVRTMEALASESLAVHRFGAVLFGVFAVAAVLVTGLGLYGMVAGYVATRRAEIAVRMSIGAGRRDVATLVARQALVPAAFGCVGGVIGLVGAGRLLQSWLYGVQPTDPGMLALLPVSMMVIAGLAVLGPLVSALNVEATELLRDR